ncbi:hypothetical protein DPMN_113975 [Dreissena polymorpha]|uniref:Uncharacterized protein n=1 Tax=Dreissena polymorpha TaxID=45954 RepID=A0A9D4QSD0_DREPO|nr:hypothetical protein DPMN_113975 [Dreissena polymorpha]
MRNKELFLIPYSRPQEFKAGSVTGIVDGVSPNWLSHWEPQEFKAGSVTGIVDGVSPNWLSHWEVSVLIP